MNNLDTKEGFKIIKIFAKLISEKGEKKSNLLSKNKLKKNKKATLIIRWFDEINSAPYSLLFKEEGEEEYRIIGHYKRNEEIILSLGTFLANVKYNFAIAKRINDRIITTKWNPFKIPSFINEKLGLLGFFENYFLKRKINFIYIKYHHGTTKLESWQVLGILRLSGYNENQVSKLVWKNFRKLNLISGPHNSLPLDLVVKAFVKSMRNKECQNNFNIIFQFLISSWKREFKKPFFIFITGASSSGKDVLVNMLKEHLSLDRSESTDTLRNQVCRELIEEYGSIQNMDATTKQMFSATYHVGIEGFKYQCQKVGNKIGEWIRNCNISVKYYNRPIYILQGVNINPAIAHKILRPAKNKLFVVLNPPKQVLKNRSFARWEREKGILTHKQFEAHVKSFKESYKIQEYLVTEAKENGYAIISESLREEVFQQFSKLLTNKLSTIIPKIQ